MKEKVLISSLEKINELCSHLQDFTCPTSANLENLSKEDIVSLYDRAWSLIYDVHEITFEVNQTINLFKTLNF